MEGHLAAGEFPGDPFPITYVTGGNGGNGGSGAQPAAAGTEVATMRLPSAADRQSGRQPGWLLHRRKCNVTYESPRATDLTGGVT